MKWKVGDVTITKITEIIYPEFSEVLPKIDEVIKKIELEHSRKAEVNASLLELKKVREEKSETAKAP